MSTSAYDTRSGWVTFSAILMFAVGFARVISAITYFDDSNDVNNLTAGLFGDSLWAWGFWDLVIAALALFAGWSLLSNGPLRPRCRLHLGGRPDRQQLHDLRARAVVRGSGYRARDARHLRACDVSIGLGGVIP